MMINPPFTWQCQRWKYTQSKSKIKQNTAFNCKWNHQQATEIQAPNKLHIVQKSGQRVAISLTDEIAW